MQKKSILLSLIFSLATFILSSVVLANSHCSNDDIAKYPQHVLNCYLAVPETMGKTWILNKSENYGEVTVETYTLNSQFWPKLEMSSQGRVWQHTMLLYRPQDVKFDTALLVVNGGIRYSKSTGNSLPTPEDVAYIKVASLTHSIIINLKDVPNQYIAFDDHILREEDGIVAYTWNRYLDDPVKHVYWLAHLPMTKTVIKALDAVQDITKDTNMPVKNFVIVGSSKRGWTIWLSLLIDSRIKAIVPIVIDIFNMKRNLNHIYDVYHGWPEAFKDYIEQDVVKRFSTKEFEQLTKVQDITTYLQCDGCEIYKNRLGSPKFIISASQDEFFPPDSLNYYVNKLPGETRIRMVPNQGHYMDKQILIESLATYYNNFLHGTSLPTVKWETDQKGVLQRVITNATPVVAKLWQAENFNARDFRYETGIRYSSVEINGHCHDSVCEYPIVIGKPRKGWKAFFVEFTYGEPWNIVLTTPGYVMGAIVGSHFY